MSAKMLRKSPSFKTKLSVKRMFCVVLRVSETAILSMPSMVAVTEY
jgi:hypothetical protein